MGWFRRATEKKVQIKVNGVQADPIPTWTWGQFAWGCIYRPPLLVVKTGFRMINQISALETSVPAMFTGKKTSSISLGMLYIFGLDLVPYYLVKHSNIWFQNFAATNFNSYGSVPAQALDWLAWEYGWKKSLDAFLHVQFLYALAASSFKADSPVPSLSCVKKECGTKGTTTGMLREPMVVGLNMLAVEAAYYIPYGIGPSLYLPLKVLAKGRVVGRAVTTDLCERHRLDYLPQEYLIGLGLTSYLLSMAVKYLLESTVGLPNWLIYLGIENLLLLFIMNWATHIPVQLVMSNERTIPCDPIDAFDTVSRVISEVPILGTSGVIEKYSKPDKDIPPLVSVTAIFQSLTQLLNWDRQIVDNNRFGFFGHYTSKAVRFFVPSFLTGAEDVIHDPIVSLYWTQFTKIALDNLELVKSYGQSKTAGALAYVSTVSSLFIQLVFGISKETAAAVLTLCNDKVFWAFNGALIAWLTRHQLGGELVTLKVPADITSLHGEAEVAKSSGPDRPVEDYVGLHPVSEERQVDSMRDLSPSTSGSVEDFRELFPQPR